MSSLHPSLRRTKALLASAALWALPLAAQPLFVETVPVGNPGNALDPSDGDAFTAGIQSFGSVAYEYRIGRYEVTNAQYAAFLNAVAAMDSFDLYNTNMDSDARGGINRAGSPGSYTYTPKSGYENMPVVFVSFWDAARFTNWLGTGTTEGRAVVGQPLLPGAAYDLGFVATPSFTAGNRLGGASIFVPSENEWYKAAYYHPASAAGPADNYWLYATRSDTQPTSRTPAAFPNSANYFFDDGVANGINGGYAVTLSNSFVSSQNYLTVVGAYGPDSLSYYGTADQNGNVLEWNDTAVTGSRRGLRGGSWFNDEVFLRSSSRGSGGPASEGNNIGFRVASLAPIPEPGAYGALAGVLALAIVVGRSRGRGRNA